jgi:succinate dehydrogenase / fumarate reductase flavoprotein subunit
VFGRAAGLRASEVVERGSAHPELPADATDLGLWRLDRFRHASGATPTSALRLRMQKVMQANCAVFRDGPVLKEGVEKIQQIWRDSEDIKVADRSQAAVIAFGAENRKESRGAHAREDFPSRDDVNWMKHTLAYIDQEKKAVVIDYRPVHTYTMTNEVKYIEPKARVY